MIIKLPTLTYVILLLLLILSGQNAFGQQTSLIELLPPEMQKALLHKASIVNIECAPHSGPNYSFDPNYSNPIFIQNPDGTCTYNSNRLFVTFTSDQCAKFDVKNLLEELWVEGVDLYKILNYRYHKHIGFCTMVNGRIDLPLIEYSPYYEPPNAGETQGPRAKSIGAAANESTSLDERIKRKRKSNTNPPEPKPCPETKLPAPRKTRFKGVGAKLGPAFAVLTAPNYIKHVCKRHQELQDKFPKEAGVIAPCGAAAIQFIETTFMECPCTIFNCLGGYYKEAPYGFNPWNSDHREGLCNLPNDSVVAWCEVLDDYSAYISEKGCEIDDMLPDPCPGDEIIHYRGTPIKCTQVYDKYDYPGPETEDTGLRRPKTFQELMDSMLRSGN